MKYYVYFFYKKIKIILKKYKTKIFKKILRISKYIFKNWISFYDFKEIFINLFFLFLLVKLIKIFWEFPCWF